MIRSLFLFCVGGSLYPTLEIAWRGKSHISMAAAGGTCLCLIDKICNGKLKHRKLSARCFAGSIIITSVEFIIGFFVNIIGKLQVWDYSSMPFNVMGQICLPFTIAWYFLTIPAIIFCKLCRRPKLRKRKLPVKLPFAA